MIKRSILVFLFAMVAFNIGIHTPNNLVGEEQKDDALGARADSYSTEIEKLFEETKDNPKKRSKKLSGFITKAKKMLSVPFAKALTKITLANMEVTCSAMPDLESAGFATFAHLYILEEVLGEKYVDSEQLINALSNKDNDWKFRWLMAETIGHLGLKGSKDVMMKTILDKSEHDYLRHECLLMVPAKGKTHKGKPIGEYFIEIFKDEKEVEEIRVWATIRLGGIKYKPAFDLLLQAVKEDSLKPIYALGEMGDRRALPVLFSLLKDKKYRVHVIEALGLMGGEETLDTLINIAENDKDQFVRHWAREALMKSKSDRYYKFLIKHEKVEVLGKLASHGHLMALEALKEIGSPRALKKLQWLSTEGNITPAKIRERARELLKEVESEKK